MALLVVCYVMVCILHPVMGCLATKEYKSSTDDIRDDAVKKVSIEAGGVGENNTSNGFISDATSNNAATTNNKLDIKKNILGPKQENPKSPTAPAANTTNGGGLVVKKNERFFTQSQIDFFEMLDKKINAGKDYPSSEEHHQHTASELVAR